MARKIIVRQGHGVYNYFCWQEMYPGEQADIRDERQKIIELLKESQQQYLEAMQSWNIKRIERLKSQGWRKVQRA